MKVLQGLWLSSLPDLNRKQIEITVDLARRFPDVIAAVIVGNEVLLRGEMTPRDLSHTIREVRSQVSMPVTYADVWEFWLRYREISADVDFITIHILPYWEDLPNSARGRCAACRGDPRAGRAAFPAKEILVGEFGWPSAGRMREGACRRPDQARALHEVLALAKRANYRVNLIEAYDQPWKRQLEGTVGGHWGLFDAYRRKAKFTWGGSVSNHPNWRWQAAGGVGLAAAIFATAFVFRRHAAGANTAGLWMRVAAIAIVSGGLIGWTLENAALEGFALGGWLRSLGWASVALLIPILAAGALGSGKTLPAFARILARDAAPPCGRLERAIGILLIALSLLALPAALGLVFDPRYRDFSFAPLTGAAAPLLFLSTWRLRPKAPVAELVMAATLGMSAITIVCNEGFANWQACWFGAGLGALALILLREPVAPS